MRAVRQFLLLGLAVAVLAPATGRAGDASFELGRRIFLEGRNASNEPVRALFGRQSTPLSGAPVACGNCHGADGRGRPEGGVVPPDITWEDLTKPYGHVRPGGRKHGPYDERSFARAITESIDPSGQRIDGAMPRYSLSVSEVQALTEYLKRLSRQRDPGVADSLLLLGTILPDSGPAAELGAAMRALLRAYVGEVNEHGGVHGRRLELEVAPDIATAGERFARRPVFALVSPYGVGREDELARFAQEKRLDVIAPFTMSLARDKSLQTFYLYPGVADLARVLLDFAGRRADLKVQRLAAFVDKSQAGVSDALEAECKRRQCARLEVLPTRSATEPGAVARLAHSGSEVVIWAGTDRELAVLLGFADRLGWRPTIYAPGAGAVRAMFAAPKAFRGLLYVAYPTRGDLQSRSPAAAAFEKLRRGRSLGTSHAAAQGFAYAAMSITLEALRQAGRDVSRERFARAVEGLYRFDAGPTPPVSYGPARRVGALGGYVVAVDPQKGFRPVSDWIGLEPL